MIKTYNIIEALSKEECRNIKILLERTNNSEDRKDIALFDYIRKNVQNIDEDYIANSLYGDNDRNSFYRLKNRLQNEINKSLIFAHYNSSEYSHVLHLINLSKIFKEKESYNLSFDYLKTAEKKALKNEFYTLLDLAYAEIISLSIDSMKFNPEKYIIKRKTNLLLINKIGEIDNILATLTYLVKTSQNYNSTENKKNKTLLQKINKISEEETIKNSYRLQLKIYHTVSRILLQQHDYIKLETYLRQTLNHFIQNKLFDKANHDTRLQMLIYLVNSLFKNNKYDESLKLAEEFHTAMLEYNGLFYKKYLVYYYNSLVINYQVTDKLKAIAVLEEAKTKAEIQELPVFGLFIYLNLSVLFFKLKDFKQSKKNLSKLKLEGNFENLDPMLQYKISIYELIVIFELNDENLFKHQLNILKSKFKIIISTNPESRDEVFLDLLIQMMNDPKSEWKKLAIHFNKNLDEKNDTDIINYNNWLESKLNNTK
ncbi:MAG: hypothetical protein HYU68_04785 [Bacteroidetes bacterium]|nr:hypothetical protein [Bacteroidota bacterium]